QAHGQDVGSPPDLARGPRPARPGPRAEAAPRPGPGSGKARRAWPPCHHLPPDPARGVLVAAAAAASRGPGTLPVGAAGGDRGASGLVDHAKGPARPRVAAAPPGAAVTASGAGFTSAERAVGLRGAPVARPRSQ